MPQTNTGRAHVARGFDHCKADWVAHVCFDSYFGSPCIFFYSPHVAAECAKRKNGVYGTREGNTEKNTGYGAKVAPGELNSKREDFTPDPAFSKYPLGKRGEAEVEKFYKARGWLVRKARKDEQIQGYDLEVTKRHRTLRIEVKSRGADKPFPDLFIQTHESNLDRRIT